MEVTKPSKSDTVYSYKIVCQRCGIEEERFTLKYKRVNSIVKWCLRCAGELNVERQREYSRKGYVKRRRQKEKSR